LHIISLTKENYEGILDVQEGDFMLNLSTDVCSVDLMKLCDRRGCRYMDTCVEPWPGGYYEGSISNRSNYAMREEVLELKRSFENDGKVHPTLISCFGANPGLISCFLKQGLLNIAHDTGLDVKHIPRNKVEWAKLSSSLNVKMIHIAERDTQVLKESKKRGEFLNTWSCYGFISEGMQPSELGWGTHEKELPLDGHRHVFGCGSGIYLDRPGMLTKVRTWTPSEKNFHGFLVTHNESISISDYFTVRDDTGNVIYRPTVNYAYHPCDSAVISIHELAGKNFDFEQIKLKVVMDEIVEGMDELGVLICGHAKNAYWFGSQLTIQEARSLAPHVSATSLQVTAAVLAGMVYCLENSNKGVLEADDIDFQRILEICTPYLGNMIGEYTDWNPLTSRPSFLGFPEPFDPEDFWQFKNVRVI